MTPKDQDTTYTRSCMEFTHIPNLKTDVSRIGLGAWAIGGWMWGGTDEKNAIFTIQHALKPNFFKKGILQCQLKGEAIKPGPSRIFWSPHHGLENKIVIVSYNSTKHIALVVDCKSCK